MEKTTPTMGALEALGTLEDRDKRGPGSRMAKAGGPGVLRTLIMDTRWGCEPVTCGH